ISNRTVKRLCADDSAGSRVKVGHCQALTAANPQRPKGLGVFFFPAEQPDFHEYKKRVRGQQTHVDIDPTL
ncbi:hypothetical protein, partial [Pantoea sp. 18069]|uniref:hypothetical protein n=1 Tax=Pantoea sp. 18069 TaxID=2681415 RepID=UPI001F394806